MSARVVESLRRGYQSFNEGDMDEFLALVDPELEVVDRPENPDADSYRGVEAWRREIVHMREQWVDYRFEVEEVLDLDAQIVFVLRQSARGRVSGAPVDGTIVHVWDIRDDRAAGMRAYSTREEAFAAEGL
jgi:ketosteroid isomerase-like protein